MVVAAGVRMDASGMPPLATVVVEPAGWEKYNTSTDWF
jgi:hypothetical protein